MHNQSLYKLNLALKVVLPILSGLMGLRGSEVDSKHHFTHKNNLDDRLGA